MRAYNFAPLWRSTIGYDHLLDLFDAAQRTEGEDHYPPYDIERQSEDRYQISLALAGFTPDEIAVTAEHNVLSIEGRKTEAVKKDYLYQGISARQFKRTFNLADDVKVEGATFENGLLQIKLVKESPETMKPRRIPIGGGPDPQIEKRRAA
jgi:molecular chaperone IbpA